VILGFSILTTVVGFSPSASAQPTTEKSMPNANSHTRDKIMVNGSLSGDVGAFVSAKRFAEFYQVRSQ
jgi:hypothetical protein